MGWQAFLSGCFGILVFIVVAQCSALVYFSDSDCQHYVWLF